MFFSDGGYHLDNRELSEGGPKKTSSDGRTIKNYHSHNINHQNLMSDFPLHLAWEIFSKRFWWEEIFVIIVLV
jgi:hypothetical protein